MYGIMKIKRLQPYLTILKHHTTTDHGVKKLYIQTKPETGGWMLLVNQEIY